MKLIRAIIGTAGAVGASLMLPAVASATDVHCVSEYGSDITIIDGRTACRAVADTFGRARAIGYDGVGYANANAGANALGIGAAGGIGASEGMGGNPIAIGFGADAIAMSTISDPATAPDGADASTGSSGAPLFAVSIALDGSRAQVQTADSSVVCLGAAAFAWNSATGAICLATPFGRW